VQFRNEFFAAVEPADLAALMPAMREVSLRQEQVLYAPGDLIDLVYFPSTSVIALVAAARDGHLIQLSSTGYENVAALAQAMANQPLFSRLQVQIGGGAIAVPAAVLRTLSYSSAAMMAVVLRFISAAVDQSELAVACMTSHHLGPRLARWLLTCEDRVNSSSMALTQEEMGMMAGALRGSISLTASEFKVAGLIAYSRGHLAILDRARLERLACECYHNHALARSPDRLALEV
jgi:CRP-like cAMP-binding protein